MARTTRKTRKPPYTDDQREAAKQRDEKLKQQAARDLADPDVIRRRIAQLLTDDMPRRLLRYSLRNQMLLLRQAEDRGIVLTDIDTKRGWNRRGRLIAAGNPGMRIVRPVGADDDSHGDADTNQEQPAEGDGERDPRPRFRMTPRWDISQTVPMDNPADAATAADCHGCDAQPGEPCRPGCTCIACGGQPATEPEATPADLLWNTLTEQVTEAGYQLIWPADLDASAGLVRADHDRRSVDAHLSAATDPDGLAALAVVLGEIVTRADADRASRRAITSA